MSVGTDLNRRRSRHGANVAGVSDRTTGTRGGNAEDGEGGSSKAWT